MKEYYRINMWIHTANGCFIGIVTVSMVVLAFKYYQWRMRDELHSIIGLVATVFTGAVIAFGFLNKYLMNKLKWRTHKILNVKLMH